jgi:hypothetical protein
MNGEPNISANTRQRITQCVTQCARSAAPLPDTVLLPACPSDLLLVPHCYILRMLLKERA